MARCVAIVLLLITHRGLFSEATGNIGCLFSETLCNQETEWCYDDYAFGRCLPLYGNMQQENMFRYNLGTGELHALEKEMQRLFQLGYRWSHTYTQCILQILLNAIREKKEFDVSSCNVDLDQDLEEALEAIEGEEVEHIDPRNLAIVRFAPSVADPHSDYADEFYFPPVNEILPPYRPNEHDERQREEEEKDIAPIDEQVPARKAEKNNQSVSGIKTENPSEIIEPKISLINRINNRNLKNKIEEIYLTPPEIPKYIQDDHRFQPVLDEYDDEGYIPYVSEPVAMPLVKRANILQRRMQHFDPESTSKEITKDIIYKKLLRRNPVPNRDLSQIAEMLNNIRNDAHEGGGPREHVTGEAIYSPSESDRARMYDYPDSRFRISEDSYYGRFPSNSFMSGPYKHEKTAGYVPFVASYDRSMDTPETSQIPELEPPDENSISYISDEIHPRYEPPTPLTMNEEKNPESNSISNVGRKNSLYDNSISRFDENGQPVHTQPPLLESNEQSVSNWPTERNPTKGSNYQPNHQYDSRFGHNSGYQINQAPPDYPMYYYSPYSQYFDYDYYDYYPNSMEPPIDSPISGKEKDVYGPNSDDPYNLERSERFDEKKPGPPFMKVKEDASDANSGAIFEPESLQGGGDWMMPMTKWMPGGIPYPFMNRGGVYYDENDLDSEGSMTGPGSLQLDDAVLDDAVDSSDTRNDEGQKERLPSVAKQVGHAKEQEKNEEEKVIKPEDSYIYVTINGEFPQERDARQLIEVILHYAKIKNTKIEELSVKKNLVAFKLVTMPPELSPAELAEKIEELRPVILEKTHIEITQAGIGTKTGLSGVVQQANDRNMEAAAAIVCGICGALLVTATALFFLRRNAKSNEKLQGISGHDTEASKDYQDLCRARMAHKTDSKDSSGTQGHGSVPQATTQRVSSLSKESENGNNSPSSRSSTSSWSEEPVVSNMDISTGHMVLSYMEDHLKNKDRLDQEWVDLCSYEAEPCACNIALKGDNAKRNRYQDCVSYDHNRVILNEHTNINGSNYINASSIKTDHDPRNPAYIATQGPLSATSADFWQLVWEQGSVVIVMLTRLTENGQSLCHRYWPEEGSELYHIYEVHLVSEHIWCDDYLVRSFYLKNIRTGETRTVTQFHFLSWPESGTPASTKALLEFRRKVNKSYRGRSCPIIVHCSDGVGRTGTYCLIDMVLNRMVKGSKEIDIAATLEHIRDQRPVMVKTKAQFEFVLMAVAEEVHAILKALPQ